MSDIKKDAPEAPPLKELTKKHFEDQIKQAQATVDEFRRQINSLTDQIQQQIGLANYADHILKTFKLPDAPKEEPKKKTDLEVK